MEVDKNTEDILSSLKEWVKSVAEIPQTSDDLLKRFAYLSLGDEDCAKRMLVSYYTLRTSTPELFCDRDVDNAKLSNILGVFNTFISPKSTPEGYRILLSHIVDTDTRKYDMMAQMKYFIMTLEASLVDDDISPGYIIIFDISTLATGHVLKFSPSGIRKTSTYLQEGIPLHVKEVFLINASPVVDFMMRTARPFVNDRMLKKTKIYKACDLDKLYEKVPRECLPQEYGGLLFASALINEQNTKKLRSLKSHFAKEEAVLKTFKNR